MASQTQTSSVNDSELGIKSHYESSYNPDKLFPISRTDKRLEIGVDPNNLPFVGFDRWTHYEVSWLNSKGKPMVGIAEIVYPCDSHSIIESKSLKLYFNTLNNTKYDSVDALVKVITADLTKAIQAPVSIQLSLIGERQQQLIEPQFTGICLDDLDVSCDTYQVEPNFLEVVTGKMVNETVHSNLLKSNCLVTHQPDWGSIQIQYAGEQIAHQGLLKYIVSFREHNEFHEQCIERIFNDIMQRCHPSHLTVYGRYTRRGGLDINPIRSTHEIAEQKLSHRLIRQ
jgi:7-cyano-7-deazaguanine reductase